MRRLMLCLALSVATPAIAQTAPPTPAPVPVPAAKPVQLSPAFKARAKELLALLGGTGSYESLFSPAFREKVPKAQFDQITAQLSTANGPVNDIEDWTGRTPDSGTLQISYRDAILTFELTVDPAEPHQIIGLFVRGGVSREKSLDEVVTAIKALRGTTGFALAKLGSGAPTLLTQHNADRAFAVGSAFKLVILAELIRVTNAGERGWDDMVTIDGGQLPGGAYMAKQAGTRVSLRELATAMISVSDNSATDLLLKTLGREKVEAMLPVLGVADPARNRPYIGTLEVFKLKGVEGGALGRRYLAKDEAGRRAMLASEVAQVPLIQIPATLFQDGKPVMIEQLEWYFTPTDLARVMDWLRRNTDGAKGTDARAVLSKNPGLPPLARAKWQWAGYKGGSEPGVMNMTYLLQSKGGEWYALTGSWNDPAQEVDQNRFASLMGRAAELAAP